MQVGIKGVKEVKEARGTGMDDLEFSINCLGVSIKKWYKLEQDGLAQARNEFSTTPSILFRGYAHARPEYNLLFNPPSDAHESVDMLGRSNHSVVYGQGSLAYKVIRLDLMTRQEQIIGSLRELAFLHSLGFPQYIMHPLRSQWSMKNGALYTVIHEMPRAKCTLYDCLSRKEFTGLSSIKTAMSDVLQALRYLHDRGVVHGDIKPQNILMAHGSFHATLSDFTLTHFEGHGLIRSAASAYWKAPELSKGSTYTKKADVWSWGMVWMDCLHGELYGQSHGRSRSFKSNRTVEEKDENDKSEVSKELVDPQSSWIIKMSPEEIKEWEELRQGVLHEDPNERWSVDRILQHPWFKAMVDVRLPNRICTVQWEPSEYENMKSQATAALFLLLGKPSEAWLVEDVTVLSKRMAQHLIRHSFRFHMDTVVGMCVETTLFLNGYLHPSSYEDDALFWPRLFHVFHILKNRLFCV